MPARKIPDDRKGNLKCINGGKGDGQREKMLLKFDPESLDLCIDDTQELLNIIPDIYQRGESINWILPQHNGRSVPRRISESNLTGLISRYITYFKERWTKDGLQKINIFPPKEVMNAIYTAGYWPKVPYLKAITNHPVVRRDGSTRSQPGYDPRTQVFSTHSGDLEIKSFTQEEATHARAQLLELVDEFPFVGVSADVWLATVLTPLVRTWCGPAPFFIITSSTPSAGKGRLVDISSIISCGGGGVEATALPTNTEEWPKCLLAWAFNCPEIIYFDNVFSGSTISSPVLDMALTKDNFTGRVLGQSKSVEIELLTTWMASGNNISTTGDTARRTLICRIEPMMEYPEYREFRISNILAYTKKHRSHYLSLACGILSGWLASRGPIPTPPLGSFEGWSYAVRGAIIWAGGADISEALATHDIEGDSSAATHRALLAEWHKSLERPVTAKELLDICESATPLHDEKLADIVSEFCPGKGVIRFGTVKQLSFRLRGIENRVRTVKIATGSVNMAVTRVTGTAPVKWIVESANVD